MPHFEKERAEEIGGMSHAWQQDIPCLATVCPVFSNRIFRSWQQKNPCLATGSTVMGNDVFRRGEADCFMFLAISFMIAGPIVWGVFPDMQTVRIKKKDSGLSFCGDRSESFFDCFPAFRAFLFNVFGRILKRPGLFCMGLSAKRVPCNCNTRFSCAGNAC